jgi:hypothetical protein
MARKKPAAATDDDGLEKLVREIRDIADYHATHSSVHVDPETGETWIAREMEEVLVMAMRFALTTRGATKNCRNPRCRKIGCQLRLEENGDGVCPGGMTSADLDQAALMLAFLIHFARRYAPWAFGRSKPERHSPIYASEKR